MWFVHVLNHRFKETSRSCLKRLKMKTVVCWPVRTEAWQLVQNALFLLWTFKLCNKSLFPSCLFFPTQDSFLNKMSEVELKQQQQRVSVPVLVMRAYMLYLSESFYFAFHNSGIFKAQRSCFKTFLKRSTCVFCSCFIVGINYIYVMYINHSAGDACTIYFDYIYRQLLLPVCLI